MNHELVTEVEQAIENERIRASEQFGLLNHSDHESFGQLYEKYIDANAEFGSVQGNMMRFFEDVARGATEEERINWLEQSIRGASRSACYLIEYASAARRAMLTVESNRDT